MPTAIPAVLLTVSQVAERLGKSHSTIYKLVREGQLRHFRYSAQGKLQFSEEHVAEFLASIERKPMRPRQRGAK